MGEFIMVTSLMRGPRPSAPRAGRCHLENIACPVVLCFPPWATPGTHCRQARWHFSKVEQGPQWLTGRHIDGLRGSREPMNGCKGTRGAVEGRMPHDPHPTPLIGAEIFFPVSFSDVSAAPR